MKTHWVTRTAAAAAAAGGGGGGGEAVVGQRRHQGRGVTAVRGRHDGAAAVDIAAAAVTATASTSGGFPRGF